MTKLFHSVTPLVGAHFSIGQRWLGYPAALAACLSIMMPIAVWAQASGRDPFDTGTASASAVYESAFSDYLPYQDPAIISWKAANDVVREFGGMAAMQGVEEGDSSAQAGSSEQSKPPAQPDPGGNHSGQDAPVAAPPAAPAHNTAGDMKNMPGHDMSKMPQKAPATAPKSSPAPKPATPNSMPGHGGMHH